MCVGLPSCHLSGLGSLGISGHQKAAEKPCQLKPASKQAKTSGRVMGGPRHCRNKDGISLQGKDPQVTAAARGGHWGLSSTGFRSCWSGSGAQVSGRRGAHVPDPAARDVTRGCQQARTAPGDGAEGEGMRIDFSSGSTRGNGL